MKRKIILATLLATMCMTACSGGGETQTPIIIYVTEATTETVVTTTVPTTEMTSVTVATTTATTVPETTTGIRWAVQIPNPTAVTEQIAEADVSWITRKGFEALFDRNAEEIVKYTNFRDLYYSKEGVYLSDSELIGIIEQGYLKPSDIRDIEILSLTPVEYRGYAEAYECKFTIYGREIISIEAVPKCYVVKDNNGWKLDLIFMENNNGY